ncbi:MAG: TatD family hydrolase [Faecalibacterium sp.]|nr:TatD family hydrolase [Ruminococcus sp.]MCM1391761.1 TatD family hydrolase [Ruminococcus sp.]MCM1485041.1 TatD family hydrolase [Faecalibacterium sp.]
MMYSGIFDTHAHYDDEKFNEDRAEVLSFIKEQGVCNIINCGCNLKSSLTSIELADKYDFVYAAIGVHPSDAEEATDVDLETLKRLYNHKKVIAAGEIGLDYHYDFSSKERQLEVFEYQIQLANELDLPVIVHDREAHEDTLNLLKKYKPKGVVHCFSGSTETAREVINIGMYIGLGGAVTFKNAKKPIEVAKFVPSDRILLETDCPYMAPVPFRGKRCDSSLIPHAAAVIAGVRGEDIQSLIDTCRENANRLFLNK